MTDRWLTLVLDRTPEQPARPDPPERTPATGRRPVSLPAVVPPPRRHLLWSVVAAVLLAAGVIAALAGAWMVTASALAWDGLVRESAEAGEGLVERSQAAAAALADEFAGLDATASTLGEVSTALDTAIRLAADLEAVAATGDASGPDGLVALVGAIDRLAGAIDAAFPGLAELGVAGPDGPGGALQRAVAALIAVFDASATAPVTGFGPFVLQYPLPGHPVTRPFGTTPDGGVHHGVDIAAPALTPILAAADGVVLRSGWLDEGAGNGVVLGHEGGWETRYFHMADADLPVTEGEQVSAGRVIGAVGSTGESTGPHLHFEIVWGPARMDPEGAFRYLGGEGAGTGPTDPAGSASASGAAASGSPGVRPPGGTAPDVPALAEARAGMAGVRRDLLDVAADASAAALALDARSAAQRDRAADAALVLYAGAVLVAMGLLLLWVTRPRWPAGRRAPRPVHR